MDLVRRYEDTFCNLAIEKGDGQQPNDSLLFDEMKNIFCLLYNHPSGKQRIISLLDNKNEWVRSWIAAQVLSEGENKKALLVLESLMDKDCTIGFSAEITISEFKNGTLKSPFGINSKLSR